MRWLHPARKISGAEECAILLEKMMFDQPHVIDADLVGQFDLIQRFLEAVVLGIRPPRAGQLMLVEDPKLHSFLR